MAKVGKDRPKKKLLFKLWQFPHLSETFITSQIITAIKCGFEVSILAGEVLNFEKSKQQELLQQYRMKDRIILEDFKIPKNKLVRVLKLMLLLPVLVCNLKAFLIYLKEQDKFSLGWFYRFHFYAKLKHFDIIHVQYGTNVHPIHILKKAGLLKAKLIVSFHGHDAFFPINGFIENNGYYDELFAHGDAIVANTPYLADKIAALGCPAEKLKVIPVGIDTEYFSGNPMEFTGEKFKLINVGRLDAVKGHTYAIEVVKKLRERKHNVTLTIIGEGREKAKLEQQIITNNLQQYINLVGAKSQAEIRDAFLNHHAYIFCAVPLPDGRRETQGLATLEAQACGLPAIVFDSGGVKYTVQHGKTGFICDEYDVDCVVEKVESLIQNPENLAKIRHDARSYSQFTFDRTRIAITWCKLYKKVLALD